MKTYYLIIAGIETVAVEIELNEGELDLLSKIVLALNEAASDDAPRASLTTESPRYELDEIISVKR